MLTLWDVLTPRKGRGRSKTKPRTKPKSGNGKNAQQNATKKNAKRSPTVVVSSSKGGKKTGMQARYEEVTRMMLREYGVRVRKWRSSMSGVAWQITYEDGSVSRLIESPRPKGPMSAAVFLHEIGHHAIGFGTYKPRCLEEYYAWKFSIEKMEELGLNVTDSVRKRMHDSLEYALAKALRRGLKRMPEEMIPYLPKGFSVERGEPADRSA